MIATATFSRAWDAFSKRFDVWQNGLTGYGTTRDKTQATIFVGDNRLSDQYLDDVYHNDHIAAKICDLIPRMAMRQGFCVEIDEGQAEAKALEKAAKVLGIGPKIVSAHIGGRRSGGGAIFVGADDGLDPSEPLREDSIRSIRSLQVIEKRFLFPETWYSNDIDDPNFGTPEVFRVFNILPGQAMAMTQTNILIHSSRLVLFRGAETSILRRRQNWGWDDSVLQRCYEEIRQGQSAWQSVTQLLADASQGVYTIKNLIGMIASNNLTPLMMRMGLVDQQRSSGRMLLVDQEGEKFERVPTPFAGIPDTANIVHARVAAAADIPVTRLFGTSPGGLNATGDSDTRNLYDTIQGSRTNEVQPALERLLTLIMLAKDGPTGGEVPDDWCIEWPSLWQMSPTEAADVSLKRSQAAASDVLAQIVTPEEVALGKDFIKRTGYAVNTDARQALIDDDAIQAELGARKSAPENNPNLPKPGEPGSPTYVGENPDDEGGDSGKRKPSDSGSAR